MRAEQFTGVVTEHGEGAVWSAAWGGLKCVDMYAGDVLSIDDSGVTDRLNVGKIAAVARPRVGGGMVVATERAFTLFDAVTPAAGDGRSTRTVFKDPGMRFNEGSATPDGALLVGTMAYDQTPGAASMYQLGPDGTVSTVFGGLTISNGLGFSPDGTLAYYSDTHTGRLDVFDYADGQLWERRPFVAVAGGGADGLCVDADGGIWVARYGGSAVNGYTSDGTLAQVIEVGAAQVTSCCFGGDDLDQLFITTSSEGGSTEPNAGALFRCVPGVRGLPVLSYAG